MDKQDDSEKSPLLEEEFAEPRESKENLSNKADKGCSEEEGDEVPRPFIGPSPSSAKPNNGNGYTIGLVYIKRCFSCAKIMFPRAASKSVILFILLLVASLIQQYIIYNVGLIPSRFFKILGAKDKSAFKATIFTAAYFIVAIALANSAVKYLSGLLYVLWREYITQNLQEKYFYKETFYQINSIDDAIDNADQRITQDVDKFSKQFSDISSKLLISPLAIIYYSYRCFVNTGYYGPVSIYVYFIVGSFINRIIMSPIVGLVVSQEKTEGDFRFKHVNVRTNSESVAFLQGAEKEHWSLRQTLERLLSIQQHIVSLEFWLNFCVNLFDYLGSILSYFVIAIPIFAGTYDDLNSVQLSSLISQNAFVSMYLINCFSSLMDLSGKVTDIAGYTHRIGEMLEALSDSNEDCKKKSEKFDGKMSCIPKEEKQKLVFYDLRNVTYSAWGSEKPLVKNLNLTVMAGQNILIVGATGTGKSSLLRVLRNLWYPNSGELDCFLPVHPKGIFFLPQKFFLTNGSLFDQVRYPLQAKLQDTIDEEKEMAKVLKCIEDVSLKSLLDRIESTDPSSNKQLQNILSPGEMQRLSFARVFYHRPKLAVLDEPTSALGEDEEECFYTFCRQLNITFISVGHRESLKKYHDCMLTLKGDGAWEFAELEQDSSCRW